MTNFLTSLLGVSWRTSLFGIMQLLIGTSVNYYQSLTPGAAFDYHALGVQALLAIAMFFTKDARVTGGTVPATPEAATRTDVPLK